MEASSCFSAGGWENSRFEDVAARSPAMGTW
jgi:hypothetical protein